MNGLTILMVLYDSGNYIAPQSSSDYYKTCFDYIASLANRFSPVIIKGDFNLPDY